MSKRSAFLLLLLWWPASLAAQATNEARVVDLALQNQPGLKAAVADLESADWSVASERARYTTSLVLDTSYTRNAQPSLFSTVFVNTLTRYDLGAELRQPLVWGTQLALRVAGSWQEQQSNRGFGFTTPGMAVPAGKFGPGYGFLTKLSLKQPLLRGRGREVGEAQLAEARAQRTQAQRTRDRIASELLRDVLTAYWELWYADRTVAIEQESLGVAEKLRDEAAARARTGSIAQADVLTFETQVAQRMESLLTARTDRQRREHDLRRLLGRVDRPEALAELEADDGDLPGVIPPELAEKEALDASLVIHESRAAVALAQVQARTAADPLRARLDFDSYIQVQGLGLDDVGDTFDQYREFEAVSAFVGLTYETPLNTTQKRAAEAKARLAVTAAEERLAQSRDSVLSELHIALDRQTAEHERLALVETTVQIAERQLAAEQARYQSGTSTPLSVTQAEDNVRTARLRVARSHADLRQVALSLEHQTGRLLARHAKPATAIP